MIDNKNDVGFIHDIASLDHFRQQAINGDKKSEKAALISAAKQFEAIFTSMLFKSMRSANTAFESDMTQGQNGKFYRNMLDEQMASDLSSSGSLGLADMIVAQLSKGQIDNPNAASRTSNFDQVMKKVQAQNRSVPMANNVLLPNEGSKDNKQAAAVPITSSAEVQIARPVSFESPKSFITSMKPYAEKAAKALGIDSSLLLAQAALETGWGKKVVKNVAGSSNNLFNIKADRSWHGNKVATQTLEYQSGVPVMEKASFRAYDSYQDSFNDYVHFLQSNPRYEHALASGNGAEFIRGIHSAGYATDPQYSDKILRIKHKIDTM